MIPTALRNYVSKLASDTEKDRIVWRDGEDGRTYKYTLRDFEARECIFVHVPRAAGTSVSRALFGHSAGGHKTVREYERIFGDAFWTYYTFSFVRNPYVRLVSAYEYLRRGGHPAFPRNREFGEEVLGAYDGFPSFVLQWLRPDKAEWPLPHFYPQTHFLKLEGEVAVDFVGHVETIEADFATVCDHLGETPELPEVNRTPGGRAPLSSYYDSDAVRRRVQEVYRSDFETLGYSRDVGKAGAPPRDQSGERT
ncbi:MAG: hypothetical protein BRD27_03880, partial [Bacteroidetes bacterium QH_10_64_19]